MKILALLVFSLLAPAIVLGGTSFKGTVTDSAGAAIPNAMVLIHWDSAGSTVGLNSNVGIKEDLVIRTRQDGAFAVELPPGFYDVFVAAISFNPTCRKVRLKSGERGSITLRMDVAPLYTAEMGFQIEGVPPKR